ncbi:MAG: adenosylcobinamide-GDP ribazoletransferase [Verrucomicrobiota bacterium]
MRATLNDLWSDFLHALQFLTRLPVDRWIEFDPSALPRCVLWFPLVGGVVGLVGGLAFAVSSILAGVPWGVAVLIAILTIVAVTGGLHEDGLADAADGLCGHATRERALEIMRDSRTGAYGIIALIFAFAFRFEALRTLGSGLEIARVLIAAGVVSRAAAVFLLSTAPNVRPDSTKSGPFAAGLPPAKLAWCLGLSALSALVVLGFRPGPVVLAALVTLAVREFFMRRLGGITGDCLGATIVLTEIAVLVGR